MAVALHKGIVAFNKEKNFVKKPFFIIKTFTVDAQKRIYIPLPIKKLKKVESNGRCV